MSRFDPVEYEDDGTRLTGHVARPAGSPRAVVLIFPTIMNPTPAVEAKAWDLAQAGYLAMIADFYGKTPDSFDQSRLFASEIRDTPELYRQRLRASLRALVSLDGAEGLPIFIIGFCMGGQAALELAREGAPVEAAVSFHGLL
ncbi:MAG: dienelactone hydrolase family protein, partial [Alteraurantiacibacter sp.]